MILLYILPVLLCLFFFFGLCCMDTSTIGKWIHILLLLSTFVPGLNLIVCCLLIYATVDVGISSDDFIHCKKFWIWLLGNKFNN